jgi:hypothetical protein
LLEKIGNKRLSDRKRSREDDRVEEERQELREDEERVYALLYSSYNR